jgi:hypothetical protein
MSSPLANLPSRGLLVGPKQSSKGKSPGVLRSIRRTPHAPHYFPTNDTSPPKDQLILTDESNRLLSKFHALIKEKESKSNKRSMDSAPGASSVRIMAPTGPPTNVFATCGYASRNLISLVLRAFKEF